MLNLKIKNIEVKYKKYTWVVDAIYYRYYMSGKEKVIGGLSRIENIRLKDECTFTHIDVPRYALDDDFVVKLVETLRDKHLEDKKGIIQ